MFDLAEIGEIMLRASPVHTLGCVAQYAADHHARALIQTARARDNLIILDLATTSFVPPNINKTHP